MSTKRSQLLLLLLLLGATILRRASSLTYMPRTVIGGLFDEKAFMRNAFSLAVRTMNECAYNRTVCETMHACKPRRLSGNGAGGSGGGSGSSKNNNNNHNLECDVFHRVKFTALVLEVDDDPLNADNKFGQLAGHQGETINNDYGLAAIIGPHRELSARYIQGLCEIHDLPHIVIRKEIDHDRQRSINLYPDLETLATVYVKMVEKLNWTSFTVLYERTEQFLALDKVLKMYGPFAHPVYAFHLGNGPNYSQPLLLAKEKEHKCLIIDCSYENLENILQQTQQVGMMTESYRYIVTSLDLQTIDLHPYQYSGVNISGIRLVDPDDPFVNSFVNQHLEDLNITRIEQLRTDEALMFDAVALFAQAYKDLSHEDEITGLRLPENYGASHFWPSGLSLRNYILYNTINGLTGPVMLDSDGVRRRFKLDILNLHKNGLTKVGIWNPDDGFDDLRLMNEIKLKHFKVLITMNPPYASRVNFSKSLEGNDRYEGFVVDIIKELSAMLSFNYTFYVQEDSQNGVCNKTHKCVCTGMMEKILNHEMDMAITDLTITQAREQCVDFSTAFWNLGMSILYKKPIKAPPTLFSFLSTFNSEVWMYLAMIYVFVSLLFFALGRLSPGEWNNPFPCLEEPRELHNQFSVGNSFWFTVGAIMQQGSEIAPTSKSTRTLAGCWWFYCLIIVSTYTANLAAFLTIESPVRDVRGIEDLYNQTAIKFGAKKDGSTHMYFESSKNPRHKQLAEQMNSKEWQQKYMVTSNEAGIDLVRKEKYAFLMESSSIEYIAYRECDLEQAGPLIDQKSYAIAYAEDFEYGHQISMAISKLQEKLVIKNLYNKWWKEKGVCFSSNSNTPDPMNLDQLAGVFLVLGVGVCLSLVLTIYEFCEGVKAASKKENVDFLDKLSSEAKFITTSKAVKPVLRRNKSLESNASDDYSCNYTMTTQA